MGGGGAAQQVLPCLDTPPHNPLVPGRSLDREWGKRKYHCFKMY